MIYQDKYIKLHSNISLRDSDCIIQLQRMFMMMRIMRLHLSMPQCS